MSVRERTVPPKISGLAFGMDRFPRDVLRGLEITNDTDSDLSTVLLEESAEVGRLEVDYHDPEQVFEVVVRRVRRRWLELSGDRVLADVDGNRVALVSAVVGVRVEVTVDAVGDPGVVATSAPWPAELVARKVRLTVRDDVSTAYRATSGEAGGEGHPWRFRLCFMPAPPPEATTLTIEARADGRAPASITLPLT